MHSPANEVMASMDETRQHSTAEPSDGPAPEVAAETTERAVPTSDDPAPQPAQFRPSASVERPQPVNRRLDAGNTALLVGIIVGLIGSVSVLIGIPVFLLNEGVNRARDEIEALNAKMDTRFETQDAKIERRFEAQDAKIEQRFATQAGLIEQRFGTQAGLIEQRFAIQDAKIEELRRGLSEIDRKLEVLIAALLQPGSAEAALEGGLAG